MNQTESRLPSGSSGLPLLGETLSFISNTFGFIDARYKQHGPVFRTHILGDNLACFVGPEALTAFFDEANFTREAASPPGLRSLLSNDAVPFLDGPAHKIRKRLLLKAVGPSSLPIYLATMQHGVNTRLEHWSKRGEMRLVDEVAELAFAITYALFAGGDVDRPDAEVRRQFDLFSAGIFALPINAPFATYGKAMKARAFLRKHFAECLQRQKTTPGPNIMSAMVQAELDGVKLTEDEIVTETLHFFFAAYSGMCAFLTNLCVALSRYPKIQERLRAEVARASASTVEGLSQLPYLDQVCREVKRFYPVIPFTFFAKAKRDVKVGDLTVPAGWKALGCTFSTMHEPKVFKDPETFDPDRYDPGREEHKQHPHAFVPQGSGPVDGHRCAGEAFSTVLMKVLAVELLNGYAWETPPQDFEYVLSRVPPTPRDGLRVTLHRADASRAAAVG